MTSTVTLGDKVYITLRHHAVPRINANDFRALKRFEAAHPELYAHFGSTDGPQWQGTYLDALVQANAFNQVFHHSRWGEELKRLMQQS